MQYPRLKKVFPPIALIGDEFSLGIPSTPRSAQIDDERGELFALVQLLDGTKTTEAVHTELGGRLSFDDVAAAIDQLAIAGFVEDASEAPPAQLTRQELGRYSRNLDFFSFFSDAEHSRFSPQVMLKQSRVTILGVGGLGSHVALHLAGLGVGRLRLIDFDVVEESNLNRQLLFTETDLGRSKVAAAAHRLSMVNSMVDITAVDAQVQSEGDAAECLSDCDLFICAADRPRIDLDRWLNTAALAANQGWLRGSSIGLTAVLNYYLPGVTGCVECQLQEFNRPDTGGSDIDFLSQLREAGEGFVNPCIAPVAGMLGAVTGFEALKILTGLTPSPLLGRQMVIDLPNTEIHYQPNERNPSCASCSATAGSLEWITT